MALPGYELFEVIGSGGMAMVYRARDTRLSRDVAIKILNKELQANRDYRERFIREGTALARCCHPNVVEIYDYSGDDSSECYLVTELVAGSSLESLLKRHGGLPWEVALGLVEQLLQGLDVIHRNEIVHRDLKPANILVTAEGVPKIADFGIARLLEATSITAVGSLVGTVRYMPPEAFDLAPASPQTDIYSLGCIAYELVAGCPAFSQDSTSKLLGQITAGRYPRLEEVTPGVWPPMAELVSRAMHRLSADRFPSAREMRDACRALFDEVGISHPRTLVAGYLACPDRAAWERGLRGREVDSLVERARKLEGTDTSALTRTVDLVAHLCPGHAAIGELRPDVPVVPEKPGCEPPTDDPSDRPREEAGPVRRPPWPLAVAVLLALDSTGRLLLVAAALLFVIRRVVLQVVPVPAPEGVLSERGASVVSGFSLVHGVTGSALAVMLWLDPLRCGAAGLAPALVFWSMVMMPWGTVSPASGVPVLGTWLALSGCFLLFQEQFASALVSLREPGSSLVASLIVPAWAVSGLVVILSSLRCGLGAPRFWERKSFWLPLLGVLALTVFSLAVVSDCNERRYAAVIERTTVTERASHPRLGLSVGSSLTHATVRNLYRLPFGPEVVVGAGAAWPLWGLAIAVDATEADAAESLEGLSSTVLAFAKLFRATRTKRIVFVRLPRSQRLPDRRPGESAKGRESWRLRFLERWARELSATHLELPLGASTWLDRAPVDDEELKIWTETLSSEAQALKKRLPGIEIGVSCVADDVIDSANKRAHTLLEHFGRQSWIDWVAVRILSPPLPTQLLDSWVREFELAGLKHKLWLVTVPGVTARKAFQISEDALWTKSVGRYVRSRGIATWIDMPLHPADADPGTPIAQLDDTSPRKQFFLEGGPSR